MIKRISHVNVFVLDQERAKRFYTETLGFEVRSDAVLDGFRWLTVGPKGQPDLALGPLGRGNSARLHHTVDWQSPLAY